MAECAVLVVDDDQAILETVADILTAEGYQVATAANGREALDCLARELPRLILLDMRMPVMDGWSFARVLHERGVHPAILVMTAAQDGHRWADEIGAAGALPKPFELPELLDKVEQLCPL